MRQPYLLNLTKFSEEVNSREGTLLDIKVVSLQISHKHSRSESSNVTTTSAASTPECDETDVTEPFAVANMKRKDSLTFGEFCLFATELRKYYRNHEAKTTAATGTSEPSNTPSEKPSSEKPTTSEKPPSENITQPSKLKTQKSSSPSYDVFLGGSCGPTTWRADVAVPYLRSNGITFYNPQQSNWVPEMIELEHQAKQTSQIIMMVLNEQTRNVVSMIESSYLAGARRRIMVVIRPYPTQPEKQHCFGSERASDSELRDLNAAMTTVHDLVERRELPVFDDLDVALSCLRKVLKDDGVTIENLSLSEGAQPVKLAHLQVGDKLVRLREAFDTLDPTRSGRISLPDVQMAFKILARRDLAHDDLRRIVCVHESTAKTTPTPEKVKRKKRNNGSNVSSVGSAAFEQVAIDFDQFCCIVSEFKNGSGAQNNNNNAAGFYATKEVSQGSAAKKSKTERKSKGSCGKTSPVLKGVLKPFCKVARWVGSSLASSSSGNPDPRRDVGGDVSAADPGPVPQVPARRRGSQIRDVYLGGTVGRGGRWRESDAIPELMKAGLSFFNPQSSSASQSKSQSKQQLLSRRRLIPIEAAHMDNSRVLLFVVLGTSRSVGAMCEAAYHIGRQASSVVLCLQKMTEDVAVEGEGGERLSKAALKDYNRGRSYLSDFANREGVPVFEEIKEAVECVLRKCKEGPR